MDDTGSVPERRAEDVATRKLKATEIKRYRERQIKRQKGICPLCRTELLPEDATLDHCHETGHVRMALHRSCNQAEGRILSWAGKRSRGDNPEEFVKNLLQYWKRDFHTKPIHHTHGQKKKKRKPRMKKTRGVHAR